MLYKKIAKDIANNILENKYFINNKLQSEITLAKNYNTSKMTIRKALSLLVEAGFIYSIPKNGYFVNSKDDIQMFSSLTGNSLLYLNQDKKITSNVIKFDVIPSNEEFNIIFGRNVDKIINIERIRYVNQDLSTLESIYMPYDMFEDMHKENAQGSIYKYIGLKGYKIEYNKKTLNAGFVDPKFLKYEPSLENIPLIRILNTGYLSTGEVFEYSISYNTSNAYSTIVKYNNIFTN